MHAKILKKDLDETIKVIILDCEAYILILDSEHFAYFNENKLILFVNQILLLIFTISKVIFSIICLSMLTIRLGMRM